MGGTGLPLASTDDGSLDVSEDSEGLAVRAELDSSDNEAASIAAKLKRGSLAMSFAFRVPRGGDEWEADYTLRRLREVSLAESEVSLVSRGANPAASAELRGKPWTVEQRRARAERAGKWWERTAPVFVDGALCLRCSGLGCAECEGTEAESFDVWLRARESTARLQAGLPTLASGFDAYRQRLAELQTDWAEHEAHRLEWEARGD